jgi:hypothetical protein
MDEKPGFKPGFSWKILAGGRFRGHIAAKIWWPVHAKFAGEFRDRGTGECS